MCALKRFTSQPSNLLTTLCPAETFAPKGTAGRWGKCADVSFCVNFEILFELSKLTYIRSAPRQTMTISDKLHVRVLTINSEKAMKALGCR